MSIAYVNHGLNRSLPRWRWPLMCACLLLWAIVAQAEPKPGAGWHALNDLAKGRIGYVNGTVFDAFLHQNFQQAKLVNLNNSSDLIQAMKSGRIDAAVMASISARAVVAAHPELAIFEDKLMTFPLGIGFSKQRGALRQRFDAYLSRIRRDGRYQKIHERWFRNDAEKAQMPEYRPKAAKERYVAAVSVADLPYVAYKAGRYVGFDIEMLQSWAADENIELEIISLEFGALLPAIAAGKADIIADGIAITEERRKAVDFSAPYAEEYAAAIAPVTNLAARVGNQTVTPPKYDLSQRRIAVINASSFDFYAVKHFPKAQIVRLPSQADLVLSLKSHKAEAVLLDSARARAIAAGDPDLTVLEEKFNPSQIAAAFRLGDDKLRQRFDRFIETVRQDGTLRQMQQRWHSETASATAMPKWPLPSSGPRLRVGLYPAMGLPFISVVNGAFIGFEVELAQRFAASEGFRLEILPMEFDGLLAALASSKADVIISNITITQERRKQVAFSLPYAEEYMQVIVRAADQTAAAAALAEKKTASPITKPRWLKSLGESIESTFMVESRWKLVVQGLWVTLIVSLFSTLLGTVLGALVCYLRMSSFWPAQCAGKLYISFVRGLPVLLLLMLIFYVVLAQLAIDAIIVAIIAFGMNFAAYVAEMFRSGVQSVDKGQFEAGIAMGFTRVRAFIDIILPQAIRNILPVYRGEFISLVKMTSIVGYIGVQDLTKASDIIRSRTFEAFFPLIMVALMYFLVIWILGLGLDAIDRRTDPAWRQRRAAGTRH